MYRNKSKMDFIWTTTVHEISGGNYLVWLTRKQRLIERNACPSSLVGNFQLNRHEFYDFNVECHMPIPPLIM